MLYDEKEVKLTIEGEAKAEPKIARYNPPWTLPFLRTNEVTILIHFSSSDVEVSAPTPLVKQWLF
jgi:SOUL heme-binding protein